MSGARRLARVLAAALTVLAVATGCRVPSDTAAVVDGTAIPMAELEAAVRALTGGFGPGSPALGQELPRIRRAALERLIDRELMLAEAARRGIRPDAAEIERALAAAQKGMAPAEFDEALTRAGTDRDAWRRAAERDVTVRRLQEQLAAAVSVGDVEIADRLAHRQGDTALPEEVRASQILVRDRDAALQARRRILAGAAFADVARQVSLSPDAAQGGDLGWFARGQMPPEFDEVAFTLPRGQLSDVVETPYGFHLFLVTDRRPARARGGAEERDAARLALLAEKREAAFRAWLAEARRKAVIRYNRAVVPG
ncbi:MAG TPA: peptidylprolyl isomerase [bacterium]